MRSPTVGTLPLKHVVQVTDGLALGVLDDVGVDVHRDRYLDAQPCRASCRRITRSPVAPTTRVNERYRLRGSIGRQVHVVKT